jgi:hypothetical protein
MTTQQGLRQASFEAIHGGDGRPYNSDMLAAMATELTAAEIACRTRSTAC